MITVELVGGGPSDGFRVEVPTVEGLMEWRSPSLYRKDLEFVYRPITEEVVEGQVFKLKFVGYEPVLVEATE